MNRFIDLIRLFQQEKDGLIRLDALTKYFAELNPQDFLWVIALLSGKKLFRKIPSGKLLEIAKELPDLPAWLMDECISVTGDSTEVLSLLLVPSESSQFTVGECITTLIQAVEAKGRDQLDMLEKLWSKLPHSGIAIMNQGLTNRYPYRFPHHELSTAISSALGLDPFFTTYQLCQDWSPVSDSFEDLFYWDDSKERLVRPYPFYSPTILSGTSQVDFSREWLASYWMAEPQYQLIKRGEVVLIWSENGELMNHSFPSLVKSCRKIAIDFVVTGQVIKKELVLELTSASQEKQRNKRTESPSLVFVANDLLEWNGKNLTQLPFETRQSKLVDFMKSNSVQLPELTINDPVVINNSDDLNHHFRVARELKCTGLLMRENAGGAYGESSVFLVPVGKYLFSGVLIYVQETILQSVERNLELSIGVAHNDSILPVAKVMLSIKQQPDLFVLIRKFVAGNTIEKFGPVRKVNPQLVFEISFETIHHSNRHKAGIILQNPQMHRMLPDKLASDITKLEELKQLL
jgi:DNA ligase-1